MDELLVGALHETVTEPDPAVAAVTPVGAAGAVGTVFGLKTGSTK